MTIAARPYLPVRVDFNQDHDSSVFRHEFRSKAAAEAYFNDTFGASTLEFLGTEGVNYEFDVDHGFRTLIDNSYARINLTNIINSELQKFFYQNGFTFELEGLTSEWVSKHNGVLGTYLNEIPDVPSAGGETAWNGKYLFYFYNNNTNGGPYCRAVSDATTVNIKSYNQFRFYPFTNAANQATIATNLSYYNKGEHVKFRCSLNGTSGQVWIDNVPVCPPQGGAHPTSWGPNGSWDGQTGSVSQLHTSNNLYLYLGARTSGLNACGTWIRNIRLFDVPTSTDFHPMLGGVYGFGDSYSSGSNFMGITVSADDTIYNNTQEPGYFGVDVNDFGDISGRNAFIKRMNDSGFGIGGMFGGGQGGKDFTASLLNDSGRDYLDLLVRSSPTMVFTNGMHNDAQLVRNGTITIANLETKLLDDYIKPVMDTGCNGWGFIIPGVSLDQIASNRQAVIDIADMLLGLPAAWDAAYPAYAGKVKVKDLRGAFGQADNNYHSSIYWQEYFYGPAAESTHPSPYGQYLAGDAAAQMAIEWLSGA